MLGESLWPRALLCDTLVLLSWMAWSATSLRQRHRGMQKLRRMRSPCLSSLTEKNEKRAIFALPFPRPKFFHYSWKPCIRGSAIRRLRADGLALRRSRLDAHPGEWTDRGSDAKGEMEGSVVWQRRVRGKSYNRGLRNTSRELMSPDTSQRYFSIARGYLWYFASNSTSTTRLTLAASLVTAEFEESVLTRDD